MEEPVTEEPVVETKQYTVDQLNDALMDADETLDRAAVPYFALGKTAEAMVKGDRLYGDGIDLGIRNSELTKEVMSTIKTLEPHGEYTEKGFTYIWQEVPIRVHYLDSDDEFFKNPDFVWYNAWKYQIPNPWKEYENTI